MYGSLFGLYWNGKHDMVLLIPGIYDGPHKKLLYLVPGTCFACIYHIYYTPLVVKSVKKKPTFFFFVIAGQVTMGVGT